ncbi:MAG: hypothetical protein L7F78_16325 [Syntrophales bacterium LBB04]|nr:hypothetical protein [Syntrophales bacterium LBB04]
MRSTLWGGKVIHRHERSALTNNALRHTGQSFSDKLQDMIADVLAYVCMTVFAPLVVGLAYAVMTGMKPGWMWFLRLFRIWILICCAPFFKLRRPVNERYALRTGFSGG